MIDSKREIDWFTSHLKELVNPERAKGEKRYLKSQLQFFGVTTAQKRKLARHWLRDHPDLTNAELVALVEKLWQTSWFELRSIGIELLNYKAKNLTLTQLPVIEKMIHSTSTWAELDVIATNIVGTLLITFPEPIKTKMREWISSPNYWVRRTAILAQNRQFRKGEGDFTLFTELVTSQFNEPKTWSKEERFFIRKAIGWALRERADSPAFGDVVTFVERYNDQMSGLTFREATRKLPKGAL